MPPPKKNNGVFRGGDGRRDTLIRLPKPPRQGSCGCPAPPPPPPRRPPLWGQSPLYGLASGPMVLFDDRGVRGNALVVSSLTHHKTATSALADRRPEGLGVAWEMGLSSELTRVPARTRHCTIVVVGAGITAALLRWGRALRRAAGAPWAPPPDMLLRSLGYWTDNGQWFEDGV